MRERRLAMLAGMLAVAGCVSPGPIDPSLVARYQRAMSARGAQRRGTEGLERLRPDPARSGPALKVVEAPAGGRPSVELSLNDAVLRALANSTDIRVVSFEPAITREEMERAAAEFDAILFGGWSYDKQDNRTDSRFGGGMANTRVLEAGLKGKTVTGAQWSLGWTMTRTWDNTQFRSLMTRWEPRLDLQMTQPLLRDAWPEVNLARLRVARANHNISLAQFRQKVEELVTQVASTYWQLVQARREVEIQQDLLDKTIETFNRVTERYKAGLDATAVQVKQAEAAVQTRKATLIRARKIILDVQDALARLLSDPEINLLGEFDLTPTTVPGAVKVELDTADQLLTALQHNPLLEQARIGIDAAEINVSVARNQKMPRLDLTAKTGLQGLEGKLSDAVDQFNTGNYLSYGIGLALEYPLGNRERQANWRRALLEREKAVALYQSSMDQVAQAVRERIRQAYATHDELQAQRAAVGAARVQLQALEDTERIRGRLSPEFLQVKLQAQEALAAAERGELEAVISYNTALAELELAKGTTLEMQGVSVALPYLLGDGPDARPLQPPTRPTADGPDGK